MLENREERAPVSMPVSRLASSLPGPDPDAHSWACPQELVALLPPAWRVTLQAIGSLAPSGCLLGCGQLFVACLSLPCASWVATGKVLPALNLRVPGGALRIEAADLSFFFFFFFWCGVWGLGRSHKGFWLPPETCLLLMVSDGLSPRDKVRLWQEEALVPAKREPPSLARKGHPLWVLGL